MPDREKVMLALEHCREKCYTECPYWNGSMIDGSCMIALHDDALSLIKEQEAVLIEWKYGFPHCPVCGQMLPEGDAVKYCLHCGQAVKWG